VPHIIALVHDDRIRASLFSFLATLVAVSFLILGAVALNPAKHAVTQKLQHLEQMADLVGRSFSVEEYYPPDEPDIKLLAEKYSSALAETSRATGIWIRIYSVDGDPLFNSNDGSLADIGLGSAAKSLVTVETLPPLESAETIELRNQAANFVRTMNRATFLDGARLEQHEVAFENFAQDQAVSLALFGQPSASIQTTESNDLVLFATAPVRAYKTVLGVAVLTADGSGLDNLSLSFLTKFAGWLMIGLLAGAALVGLQRFSRSKD
jgi:hypothetical protein